MANKSQEHWDVKAPPANLMRFIQLEMTDTPSSVSPCHLQMQDFIFKCLFIDLPANTRFPKRQIQQMELQWAILTRRVSFSYCAVHLQCAQKHEFLFSWTHHTFSSGKKRQIVIPRCLWAVCGLCRCCSASPTALAQLTSDQVTRGNKPRFRITIFSLFSGAWT